MNLPDAHVLEKSGFSAAAGSSRCERAFRSILGKLHFGQLTVQLPSRNTHVLSARQESASGGADKEIPHATWQLKSYKALRRIFRARCVGFAEGYIEGEWDSPDLLGFLDLMACNMDAFETRMNQSTLFIAWNRMLHFLRSNTRRGSRRNIAYHYDLGNDFYAAWLDEGMTYSSAVFDADNRELVAAQENKYRQLAAELDLQPQHRVLEINCGWGGFAEFAAKNYGCHVTCLTLSREQYAYAKDRIARAGLDDRVQLRLQDYRDVKGRFDRIVSIEMFEAVGEEHWPDYFERLRMCLKPGGRVGLQIITIDDKRYDDYRNKPDFIQKYIFPGGMLPSPEKLREQFVHAGLSETRAKTFGLSYAKTLELWRREFLRNWDRIARLGYSERFRRMWEYYLCYCEAGFRRGTIDVGHYYLQIDNETAR